MIIELRVRFVHDFYEALKTDCEIISIGSESCHLLIPEVDEILEMVKKAEQSGKKFKLVTSRATEGSLRQICQKIEALSALKTPVQVVINDLGVLSKLRNLSNISYSLGHLLVWSLESCPWYSNLIRDEDPEMTQVALSISLDNARKIELYRELGIKEIEADAWETSYESMRKLKEKYGFELTLHLDRISASFSRMCPTAKFLEIPVPECRDKCNFKLHLELTGLWNAEESGQFYTRNPNPNIRDYFNLTVEGNWIYREIPTDLSKLAPFNRVILHWNKENQAEIESRIHEITHLEESSALIK